MLNQQDETKQVIQAALTYKNSFSNYLKYSPDDVDKETVEKFDFLAHKNVKYLFYKLNNYLLFNELNMVPVRHSKINENKIVMEEIQNKDWQYYIIRFFCNVLLYQRQASIYGRISFCSRC